MTLCKAWIQATDGRYYADPTWYGPDWFVLMDDKDSEVVISQDCPKGPLGILIELGFEKPSCEQTGTGTRLFPKDWTKGHGRVKDCKYRKAYWFAFTMKGQIIPIPHKYRGILKEIS